MYKQATVSPPRPEAVPKAPPKKLPALPPQLIGHTEITDKGKVYLIGEAPPDENPKVTAWFDPASVLEKWDTTKAAVFRLAEDDPPSEWKKYEKILQQYHLKVTSGTFGSECL